MLFVLRMVNSEPLGDSERKRFVCSDWFGLVHPIGILTPFIVAHPDFSRFVSDLKVNGFSYCGVTFPGEISFIEVDISCFTEQVPGTVSPAEEVHTGFSRGVHFGGAGSRWLCERKLIFVCSEGKLFFLGG